MAERIAADGYFTLAGPMSSNDVSHWNDVIDAVMEEAVAGHHQTVRTQANTPYAVRDVFSLIPQLTELAAIPALFDLAAEVLGPETRCVRATIFEKPIDLPWGLPWHRDMTIGVRQRADVPGFTAWSVKSGIPHVRPPREVLDGMLALRLSLDANDDDNGALRVIRGSHRDFDVSADAPPESAIVTCATEAGGVVAMRPTIMHGSLEPREPRRRRIVHFEYADRDLPQPLEWRHDIRPSNSYDTDTPDPFPVTEPSDG
ncbi:phytanoyl-CoA dioxygenase family protein [Stratiformator vulcanicus]|uniref:phytanoyl-CoA dioxygenase family protein n=1 Tax=Stratiformator vulcanicus TaxID=2527980 RepID=UPI0011A9CD98|nr:phytanoyl-CoA dioxygenase family protein [Stratiformator vulcanicus]